MSSGTSTVSSGHSWQYSTSSALPSRTHPDIQATPILLHSGAHRINPRATPDPSSTCPPDTVVIHLTTTLVIPDYRQFYSSIPIDSFRPTYQALPDASLISPAFLSDLKDANTSLVVTGILAMLFLRNVVVSGDYIRRGKVKNKILFYLLFFSQLLSPVSFVPVLLSYFTQTSSCTVVIMLSCAAASISLAILITGILGLKVYKCLNNSRIVFVALVLFQLASAAIVALDVATMKGERRLSGSCIRTSSLKYTRIYVTIQFAESLFICFGFLYACYKSRGSPSVRGRISLRLSLEDLALNVPSSLDPSGNATCRGWWDYAPDPEKIVSEMRVSTNRPQVGMPNVLKGVVSRTQSHTRNQSWKKGATRLPDIDNMGDSTPNELLSSSIVRIAESPPREIPRPPDSIQRHGQNSPVPSSFSRIGRLIPRMELFRAVMRDELLYTTFITATCVIVAILAIVGLNVNNGLTVTGWIVLNWGIISVLTIHSFGRVVHRHERDALLQHPATCDLLTRAGYVEPRSRRVPPSSNLDLTDEPPRSLRSILRNSELKDPFSDDQGEKSQGQTPREPREPTYPLPIVSSDLLHRIPFRQKRTSFTGSALMDNNFPTSGRVTPLVPHDGSDGTLLQEGWILEPDGGFEVTEDGQQRSRRRSSFNVS